MAIIHIPEEQAVNDFRFVLSRIDEGNSVVIDRANSEIQLQSWPARGRTVEEALAILAERGDNAVIDDSFADDIQFAMDRMRSLPTRPSPWD
jgi:hypothetical protein